MAAGYELIKRVRQYSTLHICPGSNFKQDNKRRATLAPIVNGPAARHKRIKVEEALSPDSAYGSDNTLGRVDVSSHDMEEENSPLHNQFRRVMAPRRRLNGLVRQYGTLFSCFKSNL